MLNFDELEKLIFSVLADNRKHLRGTMNYTQYLEQCRTVSIQLPRRCGKTEFLKNHMLRKYSALYLAKYPLGALSCESYIRRLLGTRENGLKYRCILLDEHCTKPEGFHQLVYTLQTANMLEDDFFVLSLYTPLF